MKKIIMSALLVLVFCAQGGLRAEAGGLGEVRDRSAVTSEQPRSVLADEVKPEQNFKDNKAVIAIQKQPSGENTQKQSVKNNWFCVVVQVNGKVMDNTVPVAK